MSELGNRIRQKLPRIILNLAVLFCLWFITTLISPAVQSIGAIIPGAQVSTGFLIILSMIVIMVYFAISVVQDVLSVADSAADTVVGFTHLVKEEAGSVKSAIKEVVLAVVLILLTPFIPGTLALIPVIGPTLATVVLLVLIVAALALFWAAGKIFYKELSKYTGHIAEVVAGEEEKFESRKAASKVKPKGNPKGKKPGKKR